MKKVRNSIIWEDNDRLFKRYDESGVDGHRSKGIRNAIVKANMGFVYFVAGHYCDRGMEFEDLVQEGAIGLVKAVEKFDRTRKKADGDPMKFTSYAVWWVNQAIVRALASKSRTIRLPIRKHEALIRLEKAEGMYIEEMGVEPTEKQLAEYSGFSVQDIRKLHPYRVVSLDHLGGNHPRSDGALVDFISDEHSDRPFDMVEKMDLLEDVLGVSRLSEKEKETLLEAYKNVYNSPVGQKAAAWEKLGRRNGVTGRSMSTMVCNYRKHLRSNPKVQSKKEEFYD